VRHCIFCLLKTEPLNFVNAGLRSTRFVVDYCDNGDEGYSHTIDNGYMMLLCSNIMLARKGWAMILKGLRRAKRNVL